MSGFIWHKFHAKFPTVSFDEFWSRKTWSYDRRDLASKTFFEQLTRHRLEHGSAPRRLTGLGSSSVGIATNPINLDDMEIIPKIEPVEDFGNIEHEYIYKCKR